MTEAKSDFEYFFWISESVVIEVLMIWSGAPADGIQEVTVPVKDDPEIWAQFISTKSKPIKTTVSTFYFGSTKHRAEHRVLNCSAPSTAPGTELLKIEHRAPHRAPA